MAFFGSPIRYSQSSKVTDYFFGTVVKTGESVDANTGLIKTGGSTNYGRELVGNTPTTQALALLHLGTIRYPGGGENRLFDITDKLDIDGLKRAIDYCALNHLSLNFTLNDAVYINPKTQLASITALQRTQLAHFIEVDLTGYAIAKGVNIESIHLGNEFVGQTGLYEQNAYLGYGRVSALLLHEIDTVLDKVPYTAVSNRPQIVLEPPNWVNRNEQADFFKILKLSIGADGQTAASKIYAVDLHGAGTGGPTATNTLELTWDGYFGKTASFDYELNLRNVMAYWMNDSATQHIFFRNSAWAYPESPALSQAGLGMLHIHTGSKLGMISVTNYVGYNLDNSALIYSGNGQVLLRAGGALFAMMSDSLRGTEAIGLSSTPPLQLESTAPSITRAFAGGNHIVLYQVNRTATDLAIDVDAIALMSNMETFVGGVKSTQVDILGSTNPTHRNGLVTHEYVQIETPNLASSIIDFTLNAYEIAQIDIIANGTFGSDTKNTLRGGAGRDILQGLGGDDVIYGGQGGDILTGGAGQDRLYGESGDDSLFGGAGADTLFGGTGNDTASYAFSQNAVTVNLLNSAFNTGDALGDFYNAVEHLTGSQFNDHLTGNAFANLLCGGLGNDTFYFSGGADTFSGGLGNDDAIQIDHVSTRISLSDGTNSRGITLFDIENIFGGTGSDNLTGDARQNYLAGGDGNDTLTGFGGNDLLRGGTGRDAIYGGAGDDQLAGGSGQDSFSGGTGNDTFIYYFASEGGDVIADYSALQGNDDIFNFNTKAFGNLALGRLSANNFFTSIRSNIGLDADDLFVFRQSDKTLCYDADGNAAPVLIADLQNTAANITTSDIWLV